MKSFLLNFLFSFLVLSGLTADEVKITETDDQILLETPQLEAAIRKQGYVSGVYRQTFLDKKTGFRDPGYGLDIADFILEPGSDEAYRDQLPEWLVYEHNNLVHGNRPKRKIEGPQICTRARELKPKVIQGQDFVAFRQHFNFNLAAPGHKTGSTWTQTIVFPAGKRYFISSQRIDAVNSSEAMFFRIDMPGHIKHDRGDTFSEIYLSYHGLVPATEFREDFGPHEKFNYRRDSVESPPKRFIRAVRLRDPKTGKNGPWLAGMTLNPDSVHEAWCHQRRYVCMIEEFGGKPIKEGEFFSAAFVVGYFDSVAEMEEVYDQYAGRNELEVSAKGWKLNP